MNHVNMTITIPKDLRGRIKETKDVNWSDVARRAFEEELRKQERKEAAAEMDQLREESTVAWDGVAAVRRWRKLL